VFIAICRHCLACAEYAGDDGLRPQEPESWQNLEGGRLRPLYLYAAAAVASGILGISSTANSSISGSDKA
jgi:hypothetical protein